MPVPPNSPAVWVPSQTIRPDGTPNHDGAIRPRLDRISASGRDAKAGGPDGRRRKWSSRIRRHSRPRRPPPLRPIQRRLWLRRRSRRPRAASQMLKPEKASVATAPSTPASTDSAPPAETPKPAAPAAPQMLKPEKAPVATASPAPASTDSASPPAQTRKPNATQTASVSTESAEPSTPKIDSKKKPAEKIAQQKPAKSPKPPVKPITQAERRSTEPAPPKEAEKSPQPAQAAGNPTALAPVPAPSVQQRLADGMTHAFGYLMHLPGALVPHLGGSDADAH